AAGFTPWATREVAAMGRRTSRRFGIFGAAGILALTFVLHMGTARAEGIVIRFQDGVLCDTAEQIENIVSQYGEKPLKDVLVALNDKTGKVSCGMVRRPVFLVMEPLRVVGSPVGKLIIIKLTAFTGLVQYAWRPMKKPVPVGDEV
ncbi:MAG: hypothetical protein ACR2O4_12535, partial [Hyphomicrobiaceae bacterium]